MNKPKSIRSKSKKPVVISPYIVDVEALKKAKKILNNSGDKELYKKILKVTLRSLVGELLPTAIIQFRNDPKGSTTYPITNIVSEIRSIISQIETSINVDDVVNTVSEGVSNSLMSMSSSIRAHITGVKRNLPIHIHDAAIRKDVEVIVTEIGREFEKSMMSVVAEIESKIHSSIKPLFVGKQTTANKKPKGKSRRSV
jgi:hypothetical protein